MRAHVMCDGHYTCDQKGKGGPTAFSKARSLGPESSEIGERCRQRARRGKHRPEWGPEIAPCGGGGARARVRLRRLRQPPSSPPLPSPAGRGAHTWPFPCWLPGGPPARRGSTVTPAGARGPCMTDSRLPRKRARVPEGSTWFQRPRSARTPVSRSPHHGSASGPD